MYVEAGADVLFIEGIRTEEQMHSVPRLFSRPCLINMAFKWKELNFQELRKLGYGIAIYPPVMIFGAIAGAIKMCRALFDEAEDLEPAEMGMSPDQLNELLGLDKFRGYRKRIGTAGSGGEILGRYCRTRGESRGKRGTIFFL
jgi:2-methylisocitrate lyase-like PEP mutase family enzyme